MPELKEAFKRVAVIGAAGKMGSGISLIILQEMARSEAEASGQSGTGEYRLALIDSNESGLIGLKRYLRSNLTKYAEKQINLLRRYFEKNAALISNEEMVKYFVDGALDIVSTDTELSHAKSANLVFEAIVEDVESKKDLFCNLKKNALSTQFYFTNTSSIPISVLDEAAQLDHRIIGFHFYNPPAIQKLLEIISPTSIDPSLEKMALEIAKRLKKTVVRSHDVAGFIGNGHFIRELHFACKQANQLAQEKQISLAETIYLINFVTQNYLLRPMGIFQVADYVGLDVCHNIMQIMRTYLQDPDLQDNLIEQFLASGIKGGQNSDGSPKNGIFSYENRAIHGVYSLEKKAYIPIKSFEDKIGIQKSVGDLSWNSLQNDPDKKEKIKKHLATVCISKTSGALIAQAFLNRSWDIANGLVTEHVADSLEDVNTVLKNGFFHLEGVAEVAIFRPTA